MTDKPLQRDAGAMDGDLRADGDQVMFVLKPMKSIIIPSLFLTPVMLGALAGAGLWYVLFHKYFFNPRYDLWTYYVIFGIPALGLLTGLKLTLPKLFMRHEISRRYIRSFSGIVIRNIETMDVIRVKDATLTQYGPFSTLSVVSKDVSSPLLKMDLIPTASAEAAFLFINDSAIDSLTELRLAKRSRQTPKN